MTDGLKCSVKTTSPLHGGSSAPMLGADIEDGIASVRGMIAIARSAETGKDVALADVTGAL